LSYFTDPKGLYDISLALSFLHLHFYDRKICAVKLFTGVINTTSIEIGLEQASFVVFVSFFSSFEHAKNLLILGPNNTKNSSKNVIFLYLTINNIVRILLLL
jgi:hypothetical protein